MMRVSFVNRHWATQVAVLLADPWTWAASHLDATSDRLGIPRCPKENALFVVPRGTVSDCERLSTVLLDARWTLDIPAGTEPGKELSYLLPTETYFGGVTDDASMRIKEAIDTGKPNGRPLGLPDELRAKSAGEEESDDDEEEESDGDESESESSYHSSDEDYSDDELEDRVAARRAARQADRQAERDARSRARASRVAMLKSGKYRRLQDKDEKMIERIQTGRLLEVLQVLRAATFRMSAADTCDLLVRVIVSGVVGICYCRRAGDRSKGPMSFAEVVGQVLASGLRGSNEQWEPEKLADFVCVLGTARQAVYAGFILSPHEQKGSLRLRQIYGADEFDDGRSSARCSYLLERRRRDQLTHPLWDVHAVLQPLCSRGWLSEADEAFVVGMASRRVAEADRQYAIAQTASGSRAFESAAPHDEASEDAEAEEEDAEEEDAEEEEEEEEEDKETIAGSVGWRESMHWVQYYHAADLKTADEGGGVHASPCTYAAGRMGRAAAIANVSVSDVGAMALALAEHEDASMQLWGESPQQDHEFSSAAFLQEWAKAANFPKAWAPADRASLIELLSDEPEVPRRWHDPRRKGKGEPPEFSEQAFEQDIGSWGRYVRYELDEYLTAPAASVVVSWLRALARESGQLSR